MGRRRDFLDKAKGIHPDLPTVLTPLFKRLEDLEAQVAGIGTVTQPLPAALDANDQRIHTVADPTANQDAVNLQTLKKYVDAAIKQAVP